MKMTSEHYAVLKGKVKELLPEMDAFRDVVKNAPRVHDMDRRLLWDVFYATRIFNQYSYQEFDYQNAQPPFSFTYDGKSSAELLKSWKFDSEHKNLDTNRTAHILTWQDPKTGLQLTEGVKHVEA